MNSEHLNAQIEQLANFIMAEIPGEPSQNEGAVECAIRLLRQAYGPDAAIAALGGGWIEIADGKPEVGQLVIVHSPGAVVSDLWPARWSGSFFDAGGGWFEQEEVLRWAPMPALPAPPAEGEK